MKEIHFKILYNILPVRKNLLKWNLASDDTRNTCEASEDIVCAFISCKCNHSFKLYLCWLIDKVFDTEIKITSDHLIKVSEENSTDHIISFAFCSIYKMILLRNKKG